MRFNIPPVTRALIGLTIFFSFLYSAARWNVKSTVDTGGQTQKQDSAIPYLTLVPSRFYYYPWTILTSTFVEQNVLNLCINLTAVFLSGRYLERAWGSKDFAFVALIAAAIPNLLVIPTYWIWGLITRSTTRADTPIAGAITLQACFMVAFKNLVPEHTVTFYRVVNVRVKHFPFIWLCANTFSGVAFGTDTALLLGWYGLLTTYLYLRIYKYQPELGTSTSGGRLRGDASETFAFATFFPNLMQGPIAAVCDRIYTFCCNVNLILPFTDEAIASSNEQAAIRVEGVLPTTTNQSRTARFNEQERRRQLALKALDERLNAAGSQSMPPTNATTTASLSEQAPR